MIFFLLKKIYGSPRFTRKIRRFTGRFTTVHGMVHQGSPNLSLHARTQRKKHAPLWKNCVWAVMLQAIDSDHERYVPMMLGERCSALPHFPKQCWSMAPGKRPLSPKPLAPIPEAGQLVVSLQASYRAKYIFTCASS